MSKQVNANDFDEEGFEKVRKPRKPKIVKAGNARKVVTRDDEAVEALAIAEMAQDPIAATQAVVTHYDNLEALAALLPVRTSYVDDSDREALMLGDVVWALSEQERAEEFMVRGREFKGKASEHMLNVVNPLKTDILALETELSGFKAEISKLEKDIRDDLFSDPDLAEAIEKLRGHPLWGKFTENVEKQVVVKLAVLAGNLLESRNMAETLLNEQRAAYKLAYAQADEWGKAGSDAFFEGETILKAAGFEVKRNKEVRRTK